MWMEVKLLVLVLACFYQWVYASSDSSESIRRKMQRESESIAAKIERLDNERLKLMEETNVLIAEATKEAEKEWDRVQDVRDSSYKNAAKAYENFDAAGFNNEETFEDIQRSAMESVSYADESMFG